MATPVPTFRTVITNVPRLPGVLTHGSPVVMLGSCFADEISALLSRDLYDVTANPFGTLYNPLTIDMLLSRAMLMAPYDADNTVWDPSQGLWHGWEWHGCMSRANQQDALDNANAQLQGLHDSLKKASLLVLTFGTAYVWRHRTGRIVANCHKLPSTEFKRQSVDLAAVSQLLQGTLQRLHRYNPRLTIMLTVSPVRHIGDGLHDNNLSKALLLMMCQRLSEEAVYFPSYEMLVDDLRDYRFYADDMCHPAPAAVRYIYDHLVDAATDEADRAMLRDIRRYTAFASHRPLHGDTGQHDQAIARRRLDLLSLYPILSRRLEDPQSDAGPATSHYTLS